MANHKSAEKRHRQSLKRRERNITQRSALKTAVKKAVGAASAGSNQEAVTSALQGATRLIDKAATHGVIHKNAARRKISRLHRRANALAAAAQTA